MVTLSAQEAADALGITTATLYSYVSRGLIRSQEGAGKSRARRYDAGDVQALKERKAQRRSPERAAAAALAFGSPILESSITLIEDGETLLSRPEAPLIWREQRTFEEVAALLWTGAPSPDELFTVDQRALLPDGSLRNVVAEMSPLDAFQTLLLPTSQRDLAAYNTESSAVARTGVRLMRLLAWCITGTESVEPLAVQLQRTWAAENPHAIRLLDAALILCADHELNISAFTARCVASAGTSPYLAINAALCALRGYRHGGQTERVDEMFDEAAGDPATAVAERLRRGQPMPGFGHPLYPQGDPRGKALVDLVRTTMPECTDLAPGRRADRPLPGEHECHAHHRLWARPAGQNAQSAQGDAIAALRRRAHSRLDRPDHRGISARTVDPTTCPLRGRQAGELWLAVCRREGR